jgi:uncharacterized protein YuzE
VKVKHFKDTDTLYIELRSGTPAETRDLDENTLVDFDPEGRLIAITIEHASERVEMPACTFEQVAS